MMRFFSSKHVPIALAVLSLGQLLYLFGFRLVYVLGLVYFVAVAVPFPAVCRSMLSRLVVAFVLVLSLLQVVAAAQFLILPDSGFVTVSLIMYGLCIALAVLFRRASAPTFTLVTKTDAQAIVMVLFFALPTAFLFYGDLSPTRVLSLMAVQSQDALSHYYLIISMADAQHLNYRTTTYYPLGFHFASAFMLDGVHANQRDLNWIQGQRVYVGMYLAWGAALGYLIFYVASQALEALTSALRKGYAGWLLALTLGPVTAVLYLIAFIDYGFLNYYYIVAAVMCGLLFMYEYDRRRLVGAPFIIYMLCVFGISMSWGPLLAPALLLIPAIYVLSDRTFGQLLALLRHGAAWAVIAIFVVELVPLAIHAHYAAPTKDFGLNAEGMTKDFHFGVVIPGLGLLCYFALRHQASQLGRLVANTLASFYLLLGAMVVFQYFTVGELRYYVIKTAFLVEIIVLAFLAACLVWVAVRYFKTPVREWITLPLVFATAVILLLGLTANPLLPTRQVFRRWSEYPGPEHYSTDVASYAQLAMENRLESTDNEVLHYNPGDKTIFGDVYVRVAANVTRYNPEGPPASGSCSDVIFSTLAYGTGGDADQQKLIAAVKECIARAEQKHQPYYVVTDSQSAPYLREILGGDVTYVY